MLVVESAVDFFQAETASYVRNVMNNISGENLYSRNHVYMPHSDPSHDSSYIGKDTQMVLNAYRAIIKEKVHLSINVDNNFSPS